LIKRLEIVVPPSEIRNKDYLYNTAAEMTGSNLSEIKAVVPVRRSVDARSKNPVFRILLDVFINESPVPAENKINYVNIEKGKRIIIIGFGPGGMFAALRLIEEGIKPVIIERGKDVQTRRRDLRNLQQDHIVNPDSNYCFGEGGAGTYSDGKLYTRSTKRGDVKKILNILVRHGAQEDILIDAHPHIGSNVLPKVVQEIRETILRCGGEIHFNSKVTDLLIQNQKLKGVVVNATEEITGDAVILATGHSARDIYYLLHRHNLKLEQKNFAMGVRIEHPQSLINRIQYHTENKHDELPPAAYNLACEINGRGVYSFCMCPGGIIVPSATSPGEIVVNGMSLSKRDSPFANSGFVVEVTPAEWRKYDASFPFAGLKLQQEFEQHSFIIAGKTQSAPAQRVTDFVERKTTSILPESSYIPGLTSSPLHKELPGFIIRALRNALYIFERKMRGYYTEEAIIVAAESRTSSPVRIPRDKNSYMHPDLPGLFPCGEGAGFAGGIVSAAIDGENCAEAAAKFISVS
jgi:uncharacterized protein